MLVGSVGMGLFVYGKKQRRGSHLVAGILLMVYPYFLPSAGWILVSGAALVGLLYAATYVGL